MAEQKSISARCDRTPLADLAADLAGVEEALRAPGMEYSRPQQRRMRAHLRAAIARRES